jgi:hypothetical protein
MRADPTKRVSALDSAVSFLEGLLKNTTHAQMLTGRPTYVGARTALAQALKAGIAPATLTRALAARNEDDEDPPGMVVDSHLPK